MAGGMIFTLFQGTFFYGFSKSWGLSNLGNFLKILGTFQPRELFKNLGDFATSGTL
ncbi:hypothetical protein T01_6106 [Trichinella spiralis]|uniref:Uncharacterized protein n=1 Tax=Trichinella spiralis TaxID=6334 RepID=A0A0V1A2F6_TRISP|nr:hypothetical protein T01_6106 [Trichinella spiralis]